MVSTRQLHNRHNDGKSAYGDADLLVFEALPEPLPEVPKPREERHFNACRAVLTDFGAIRAFEQRSHSLGGRAKSQSLSYQPISLLPSRASANHCDPGRLRGDVTEYEQRAELVLVYWLRSPGISRQLQNTFHGRRASTSWHVCVA